jgi:ceramide glucosyltransferase
VRGRLIAALLGGSYIAVLAIKSALALRYVRRERSRLPGARRPRGDATIVQPILSGDPKLEETLERNVRRLDDAAFLWIVDDDDAVAKAVCAAIAARHPARRIDVLATPQPEARHNPKLFKLERAWRRVTTSHLIVLDDDTTLTENGYAALLGALDEYDLATGLPSYLPGAGEPSRLVAQFVNDNAACTYLATCELRPPITINGMCYAMRTATLDAMGGFAPMLGVLADDLAVARAVQARHGRIYQTAWPHETTTTVEDWPHYRALMHRWFLFATLLLESESPATRAFVVGAYAVPPLLLWALLLLALRSRSASAVSAAAATLLARGLLLRLVRERTLGPGRVSWARSLVGELTQPAHALHALLRRTIRWRSRRYRVRANGDFVELT